MTLLRGAYGKPCPSRLFSHAQARMDERGEMVEIFPSTRELQDVRGVSAVPPEAPYPGGSSGRVNGTRGQLTKMTRGFTPCGSSMAAHCPPGLRVGQRFPRIG